MGHGEVVHEHYHKEVTSLHEDGFTSIHED